VANMHKN